MAHLGHHSQESCETPENDYWASAEQKLKSSKDAIMIAVVVNKETLERYFRPETLRRPSVMRSQLAMRT